MTAGDGSLSSMHYTVVHRNFDFGIDANLLRSFRWGPAHELNSFHKPFDLWVMQPFGSELF